MELNQTAARQARAYLDAHTRTDWSYPTLPPPRDQSDEELSRAVALRERYYGEFRRAITLPEAITADDIEAAFEDGLVTVTVSGAAAESGSSRIEVAHQGRRTRARRKPTS